MTDPHKGTSDVKIAQTTRPSIKPASKQQALVPGQVYDLLLLAGFALLLPGLVLLPPALALLRVPLGLAAVLLAPGYALQVALFPGREDADAPMRAGLSFGLSVALIPPAALLLDWLPWGIRPWPITILLATWGILIALVAALRRRALLVSGEAFTPVVPTPGAWWGGLAPRLRLAYAGGALAFALLLGAMITPLFLPDPASYLTEFYVLGKEGRAEDYPRAAAVGEPLSVTMGIANRERDARDYRVEIWASDPWDETRRQLVGQAGSIALLPGQSHEQPVSWSMPFAGDDQVVELLLFTGDEAQPYRRLKLWVNVSSDPEQAAPDPRP